MIRRTAATLAFMACAATGAQAQTGARYFARQHLTMGSDAPKASRAEWTTGDWTGAKTCSATSVSTRTVSCTVDGKTVPESGCADPKPAATRQGSYETCTAILQNQDLRNAGDGWWTGPAVYRAGDYGIYLGPGTSMTQQGVVNTVAGKRYWLQVDCQSNSGSSWAKKHRISFSLGSQTVTRDYNDNDNAIHIDFVGDGGPVTATVTNLDPRQIRYSLIRVAAY